MALVPSSAAAAIMGGYRGVAAIGMDGKPSGNPPVGDFPTIFAEAYHTYASAGVVLGAESGGGDPSVLAGFLAGSLTVAGFAQALAQYWSGVAVQPGTPAHGGASVAAVTNDALAKVSLFENAIDSSLTSVMDSPGFLTLVSNIEGLAVAEIVWTVTEVFPGTGPEDFEEAIA